MTVVSSPEVLATHLLEVIRNHLSRLLSLRTLRRLLDEFVKVTDTARAEQEQVVRRVLLSWFDGKAGSLTLSDPDSESEFPQVDFLIRYAGPPVKELVVDDSNLSPKAAELVRQFLARS